ncbi:MAG: DNA primase [Planctomycetota bacterium]
MNTPPNDRSDIDRVRDAADIVRIIGEHIDLKPKGREYVGLCPFHDDHKPSMNVVPHKQFYNCFSCGAAGDVFKFVQDYHKMTFGEALRYLAEQTGVKLTERTRKRTKADGPDALTRANLLEANDLAARFYQSILKHPQHGQAARQLADARGINQDMIEAFGIGAAPDRWDGLVQFLTSKQREHQPFLAAGLIKLRDNNNGAFDQLRNRLVFPIRDRIGRTIAFGGRIIDPEDNPKYLNSPESPLFDKSATLFGLDLASRAIQRSGTAVIAEGYTDVIACHQAGITNVVATLGTALTAKHAALLRQLCHTVILLFDGDDAGQRAADRAAEVFLPLPIDVKIATLAGKTDAKDPDELLKQDGGNATLERVFSDAADLLEFRDARLRAELKGAGPAQLEARVRTEMRDLGRLGLATADKVRWQFVIQRLNAITGLDPATIAALVRDGAQRRTPTQTAEPINQYQGNQGQGDEASAPEPKAKRAPAAATEAVGCLLAIPALYLSIADEMRAALNDATADTDWQPIVAAITAAAAANTQPSLNDILDNLRSSRIDPAPAINLERDIARRLAEDPELVAATLDTCLARLATKPKAEQPKQPASIADRIAEIKAKRAGNDAVDRTRLPNTNPRTTGSSKAAP